MLVLQVPRRFLTWPMILGVEKSASGSRVPFGLMILLVNASFHSPSIVS